MSLPGPYNWSRLRPSSGPSAGTNLEYRPETEVQESPDPPRPTPETVWEDGSRGGVPDRVAPLP